MSWQEVTPIIGGHAGTLRRLVRYRMSRKFGAAITIPVSVGQACGWKVGDQLKLFVGGGDHSGKLRLALDKDGVLHVRASKDKALWSVNLGRVPQLPDRDVDRVSVDYLVQSPALEISLPDHALARAPAPRVVAPSAAPIGGKVDVADKIAGGGPKPPRYAAQAGVRGR